MKKYVYINKRNIVCEIIDEFDDIFPSVPIKKRYSQQVLNNCKVIAAGEDIPIIGYIFDSKTNIYSAPPVIIPTEQPAPSKTAKELAIDALKLIDLESIDIADVLKRLEIIEGYLKITEE